MIAAGELAALGGTFVAAVVDARTGLIPDAVTRTTALAALGCAVATGVAPLACGGAYAVGGALLGLHLLTRGRGLGLGDVKLGTAIGAGFGPAAGIFVLGTAFVLGGAYATWLLLAGRAQRGDTLRFGPFLAAGAAAAALVPAMVHA
ncbi:MAG: leader peptidase (prepilin peptidase) / N-methyltransferase [Candidatus Eremiobacteraeota bacterium]|nr:leader peptidase (prepilin peptidase) / N-methyltransferase [Candidatus Eremiobacteraeota bacterium]